MANNYNILICNRFAGLATDDEIDVPHKEGQGNKKALGVKAPSIKEGSAKRVDGSRKTTAKQAQPKGQFTTEAQSTVKKSTVRKSPLVASARQPIQVATNNDTDDGEPVDEQQKTHRRPNKQRFSRETALSGNLRPNKRIYDRHSASNRTKDIRQKGAVADCLNLEVDEADPQAIPAEENSQDDTTKEAKDGQEKASSTVRRQTVINYSEYQRNLQAKREVFFHHELDEAQAMGHASNDDNLSTSDVIKAGYEKYVRTPKNDDFPKHKGRRQKAHYDDNQNSGLEDESAHRQKTYGLNEFAGRTTSRPRGRGRSRLAQEQRETEKQEAKVFPTQYPVSLNLSDDAAFPTLSG